MTDELLIIAFVLCCILFCGEPDLHDAAIRALATGQECCQCNQQ